MSRQERRTQQPVETHSGIREFLRLVGEQYLAVRSGRMILFGNRRHSTGASLNSGATEATGRMPRETDTPRGPVS